LPPFVVAVARRVRNRVRRGWSPLFFDRSGSQSSGGVLPVDRLWDREFIDRVHERDEAELAAGRIKPAHMFAVMHTGGRPHGIAATAAARAAIRWPD